MNIDLPLSSFERRDQNLVMRADRVSFSMVRVTSHHTGRIVRFVPISENHPLFDHDFWDGEMAVYEPLDKCKVNVLVLTH